MFLITNEQFTWQYIWPHRYPRKIVYTSRMCSSEIAFVSHLLESSTLMKTVSQLFESQTGWWLYCVLSYLIKNQVFRGTKLCFWKTMRALIDHSVFTSLLFLQSELNSRLSYLVTRFYFHGKLSTLYWYYCKWALISLSPLVDVIKEIWKISLALPSIAVNSTHQAGNTTIICFLHLCFFGKLLCKLFHTLMDSTIAIFSSYHVFQNIFTLLR